MAEYPTKPNILSVAPKIKEVVMTRASIFAFIVAIVILFPMSAYSKGPKNPLKTPVSRAKADLGSCYQEAQKLDDLSTDFANLINQHSEIIDDKVDKTKQGKQQHKLIFLKVVLKNQRETAARISEKLSEVLSSTKEMNKKCKKALKDYKRGINYWGNDIEITK